MTMSIPLRVDAELAPIAMHVARMSPDAVRAMRDDIVNEIITLESSIAARKRGYPMHAHDFDILRDQQCCARRRREVDYLNQLLAPSGAQGT
jgi:hypothetical protein